MAFSLLFYLEIDGGDALVTAGQQELSGGGGGGLAGGASILCEGSSQCGCVWPMCVSEDKTCGSAG